MSDDIKDNALFVFDHLRSAKIKGNSVHVTFTDGGIEKFHGETKDDAVRCFDNIKLGLENCNISNFSCRNN